MELMGELNKEARTAEISLVIEWRKITGLRILSKETKNLGLISLWRGKDFRIYQTGLLVTVVDSSYFYSCIHRSQLVMEQNKY
jgi:hypothetical protein